MQREVIHGIPFWCDKENRIYYYNAFSTAAETPKLCLGTREKLVDNWEELLASKLADYRENISARSRKPQQQQQKN